MAGNGCQPIYELCRIVRILPGRRLKTLGRIDIQDSRIVGASFFALIRHAELVSASIVPSSSGLDGEWMLNQVQHDGLGSRSARKKRNVDPS
jgi:hypothetical protein